MADFKISGDIDINTGGAKRSVEELRKAMIEAMKSDIFTNPTKAAKDLFKLLDEGSDKLSDMTDRIDRANHLVRTDAYKSIASDLSDARNEAEKLRKSVSFLQNTVNASSITGEIPWRDDASRTNFEYTREIVNSLQEDFERFRAVGDTVFGENNWEIVTDRTTSALRKLGSTTEYSVIQLGDISQVMMDAGTIQEHYDNSLEKTVTTAQEYIDLINEQKGVMEDIRSSGMIDESVIRKQEEAYQSQMVVVDELEQSLRSLSEAESWERANPVVADALTKELSVVQDQCEVAMTKFNELAYQQATTWDGSSQSVSTLSAETKSLVDRIRELKNETDNANITNLEQLEEVVALDREREELMRQLRQQLREMGVSEGLASILVNASQTNNEFQKMVTELQEVDAKIAELKVRAIDLSKVGLGMGSPEMRETISAVSELEQRRKALNTQIQDYVNKQSVSIEKEKEQSNRLQEQRSRLVDIKTGAGEINSVVGESINRLRQVESQLNALIERQKELENADRGLGYQEYDENLAKIAELKAEQSQLIQGLNEYRKEQSTIGNGVDEIIQKTVSWKDLIGSIKNLWGSMSNVIKQVGVAVKNIKGIFDKLVNSVKQVVSNIISVNNESSKTHKPWTKTAWTIAKALIGVRGLYMLIRKLRTAIVAGFTNLTKESMQAQMQLNLLKAKFMQLKNSVGAAIAPLVAQVAPVIQRIIDLFTQAFNAIAMFFGALSGKGSVMIAKTLDASYGVDDSGSSGGSKGKSAQEKYDEAVKKAQLKYDKELAKYNEKVAKAEQKQAEADAKLNEEKEKLNKQLQSFDELNNLTSDGLEDSTDAYKDYLADIGEPPELEMPDMEDFMDGGSGGGGGLKTMFEEVGIPEVISDFADRIKQMFLDLIEPIKKAWADMAEFVKNAWAYAIREVGKLLSDVWRDFMAIWQQDRTVEIFRNIFKILGDIGLIIGNLAQNIREAWNYNTNGLKILTAIRDIVWVISEYVRSAFDSLVRWSANLDFIPLFSAMADYIVSLIDLVDALMGVMYDFLVIVLEPLSKWVLEQGLPELVNILIELNNNIEWDLLRDRFATLWEHLEPFAERVGEGLLMFIEDLTQRLAEFVNSQEFENFLNSIIEWMDSVSAEDVAEFANSIATFIGELAKMISSFIHLAVPFVKWAGEFAIAHPKIIGFFAGMKLLNIVGITSALLGFAKALATVLSTVSLLTGKGLLANALRSIFTDASITSSATEAGTAAGNTFLQSLSTALSSSTAGVVAGMGGVFAAALGTLKLTGEQYANDTRDALNTYETSVYGDTLEGLVQRSVDGANTVVEKANELHKNYVHGLIDTDQAYRESLVLQEEAERNVTMADQDRIQAMQNLTRLEESQYRMRNDGVRITEEMRVKLDEAKHEVESTSQAYNNATSALDNVKRKTDSIADSYVNSASRAADVARQQEEAQRQLANNTVTTKTATDELANSMNTVSDSTTVASESLSNVNELLADLGYDSNGIGTITSDFAELSETFSNLKEQFSGIFDNEQLSGVAEQTSAIATASQEVADTEQGVLGVNRAYEDMVEVTAPASENIQKVADSMDNVTNAVTNSSISFDAFSNSLNTTTESMNTWVDELSLGLTDKFTLLAETIATAFSTTFMTKFDEFKVSSTESVSAWGEELNTSLTETFSTLGESITTVFNDLFTNIDVSEQFSLLADNMMLTFSERFVSKFNEFKSTATETLSLWVTELQLSVSELFLTQIELLMMNILLYLQTSYLAHMEEFKLIARQLIDDMTLAMNEQWLIQQYQWDLLIYNIVFTLQNAIMLYKGMLMTTLTLMCDEMFTTVQTGLSPERFVAVINTLCTEMLNAFSAGFPPVVELVVGACGEMAGAFEGVAAAAGGMVGSVKAALQELSSLDFGGLGGGLSLSGFNIGSIRLPGFANGTVIPPNMQKFIGVLGDNNRETEVVSPLSTMKQAMVEALSESGFSGGGDNADIVINVDGYELFRVVRNENSKFKTSTGISAFA